MDLLLQHNLIVTWMFHFFNLLLFSFRKTVFRAREFLESKFRETRRTSRNVACQGWNQDARISGFAVKQLLNEIQVWRKTCLCLKKWIRWKLKHFVKKKFGTRSLLLRRTTNDEASRPKRHAIQLQFFLLMVLKSPCILIHLLY